jgi:hypothetical protein
MGPWKAELWLTSPKLPAISTVLTPPPKDEMSTQIKKLVLWPTPCQSSPLLVAWQGLRSQNRDAFSPSIAYTRIGPGGSPMETFPPKVE